MPVMQQVAKDAPLMIAWEAYKATEEFANTKRWASQAEHTEGSLWAAFMVGFNAKAHANPVRAALVEGTRSILMSELGPLTDTFDRLPREDQDDVVQRLSEAFARLVPMKEA